MSAEQIFYYTGSTFFVLFTLAAIIVAGQVITLLIRAKKTARETRRLIAEVGEGLKVRLLEVFLNLLRR